MAVDAQISAVLAARSSRPRHELPLEELRRNMLERVSVERMPVGATEDHDIAGPGGDLRVRIYRPLGEPEGCVLYLHGGGFVMGSIETHDHVCRDICTGARCIVVAPDYRLAPEHPYPAALEDCEAVLRWMSVEGIAATGGLMLAGDSAGGNLAAVLALRARDRGKDDIKGQILIYPVTDAPRPGKGSYLQFGAGYSLTTREMESFWRSYVGGAPDDRHWEISPLRAARFAGLPDALVITAEFDPLRDEGEAYARKLAEAGTATTLTRYDGAVHGFIRMGRKVRLTARAIDQICGWIGNRFAPVNAAAAHFGIGRQG